jgi:hypothetical protein
MPLRWPGQAALSLVSTAVKEPKFTFFLNTGLATKTLTISANGTAVTFTAGTDFVLGTNDGPTGLAVTAANLVAAILSNATLIPFGIVPSIAGAIVTLYPPPPVTSLVLSTTAEKTICTATNSRLNLVKPFLYGVTAPIPDPTSAAQGLFWPSTNDVVGTDMVTVYGGRLEDGHYYWAGLDDAVFAGTGSGYYAEVQIDLPFVISGSSAMTLSTAYAYPATIGSLWLADGTPMPLVVDVVITGTPSWPGPGDTYKWRLNGGSWSAGTEHCDSGTVTAPLPLFWTSPHGHTIGDSWTASILYGDESAGRADTFSWRVNAYTGFPSSGAPGSLLGSGSGVPITGGPQTLTGGVTVQFGSKYGHTYDDQWTGLDIANNIVTRPGVAARGKIGAADATACVAANDGVFLTCECNTEFPFQSLGVVPKGSHALVVRDANSLAVLYRKPLRYDQDGLAEWTGSGWHYTTYADYLFAAPELFSFSANGEGLFFMHCYVTPSMGPTPPTPFPGAEFGAPNPRKIAVIRVDPVSYEPTILEVITLDTVAGSTFAVATAP